MKSNIIIIRTIPIFLCFLLSACDEDNDEQSPPLRNFVDSQLTLIKDNTSFPLKVKEESNDSNQPLYLYKQGFIKNNNLFNPSENQLEYNFSLKDESNNNHIYKITLRYESNNFSNQPIDIEFIDQITNSTQVFACSSVAYPCINITTVVDKNTGKSEVKFNKTNLRNTQSTIELNGSISGELAVNPPNIDVIPSSNQNYALNMYNNNGSFQNILDGKLQFIQFVNHNIMNFNTGPSYIYDFISVKTINNKVTEFELISYLDPSINRRVDPNSFSKIQYNPETYSFNITQANLVYYDFPSSANEYIEGNIGP
ncbi:hypothetical protein IHV21_14330 [Acinetobacter baumannii]|uniref:hypothetical protein n=1 Tax=Acinetobacter baumannii TaxID=470 RepID=UPI00186B6252|nr:hypothetical protein [Acinetobacter baumannii]MBE4721677.1 hypothetical protein [Acinetobacter baumannii]MBE4723397.1 hypothetical protein [Acinetobacter baumannii]